MHNSVRAFVAECAAKCGPGPVLDVGGFDVNGSSRELFPDRKYTSLDMRDGPGVDVVAPAARMPFAPHTFSTVVCTSMLEHDATPWLTAREIARVMRKRGHLIVVAPGFPWPKHDYPDDVWRFSVAAFRSLFGDDFRFEVIEEFTSPGEGVDVRAFGVRR